MIHRLRPATWFAIAAVLIAVLLTTVSLTSAQQVPLTETGVHSKYQHDRPSNHFHTIQPDPQTGVRSKYEHDRPSVIIRRARRRHADARLGSTGLVPIPEYLRHDRPPKYAHDHPAQVVRRFYGMETPPAETLDNPHVDILAETEMIDLIRYQARLVRTSKPIVRTALANEEIARAVRIGTNQISIVGQKHGSTSLTLWLQGETVPHHLVLRVGHAAGARPWAIGSYGKTEEVQ